MATDVALMPDHNHAKEEAKLRALAREIAMDILPRDEILKNRSISEREWEKIATNPRFVSMLETEMEIWSSALNTKERVEIKAQALVEEALPSMAQLMFNVNETGTARVAALQAVARIANIGEKGQQTSPGEKVSITINLGADKQITVEHDVTPKVIEGTAVAL